MFSFFLQWNNSGAVSIRTDSANNSSQFTKKQTDCGGAFLQVSLQHTISYLGLFLYKVCHILTYS